MNTTNIIRFWEKVRKGNPDECWEWIGKPNQGGYGRFGHDRIVRRASHVAYELTYGPIRDGNIICHSCDNPICVNPAHLWQGTHSDNHQDKARKGRSHRLIGERNPNTPFTEEQILAIREDYKNNPRPFRRIGMQLGVSGHTIADIIHRRSWSHI